MSIGAPQLLSTRLLTEEEKHQLETLGYEVHQMESIRVKLLEFDMPEFTNGIFTSQNALKAFMRNEQSLERIQKGVRAFCVGEKTTALAKSTGMHIVEIANNSEELAQKIASNYKSESFVYFSGSIAMRALNDLFSKEQIKSQEVVVYQTELTYDKAKNLADVVLFFSPSGVRSYREHHDLKKSLNVCIGPTTAAEINEECEILVGEYPPRFSNMIKALADNK